ncbi:cupredoxin domain-containing protein [Rubrobacter marinus]|uniref:cupredoxin domain-containing protein n=1 Tax=Rubrobacter marinus TaxID=2653852 RepID=UPI00140992DA|nr:plastocyanin/azurin family copper-binding protein [Rubrobacter marinus]
MKKLLFLVVLSLVVALVLAPPVGAQQGEGVTVRMEDNYFDQANITVEPGTTVTWVQAGDNPHTSTSYDGLWDSGLIQGGAEGSVSYTFEEPGTYSYFCGPHEDQGMVGTVTVTGGTEASGQQQLAATGGPSLVLPAALLLLGSGLLGWAALRRIS